MAVSSPNELMADATCFTCLEDRQTGAIIISLLVQILQHYNPMASSDVDTLMADAVCFTCLEPRQMAAVQLQLLGQIADSVANGGIVQCGAVDPVADPGVPCALYYNTVTSDLFYWDDGAGVWYPLVT